MEAQYSVGIRSGSKPNMKTQSKTVGLESVFETEPDTKKIMLWRSGLTILNVKPTVCCHRKYTLLNGYTTQRKTCCNPFG